MVKNIESMYQLISTSIINNYNCVHKLRHEDVCIKMHLKKIFNNIHLNSRIKLLSFYILNSFRFYSLNKRNAEQNDE